MRSSIMSDRITEDADWKDGMDAFRERIQSEVRQHEILLASIFTKLEAILKELDEHRSI